MKTTTTTKQLAVITEAVKPPPTKREIAQAMATIEIERRKKGNTDNREKRDAALAKVRAIAIAIVLQNEGAIPGYTQPGYGVKSMDNCSITFDLTKPHITPELKAALKEYYTIPGDAYIPDLEQMTKELIRAASASPQERVGALLADKDARAALEKALDRLSTAK